METNRVQMLAQDEAYLNGLLHLASVCSEWVGRSEISAACYPPSDVPAAFAAEFGFSPGQVRLVPEQRTLRQALACWLGGMEAKLNDSVCWLIRHRLGEETQVLRLENEEALISKLGWGEGGSSPYYFMEDVFFARFETTLVCFLLGNNE